ncbi:MAG: polysaccharide deacetylase family protein [Burkholderiales bacterium]|jgi:peptidoglycan/xylan/chitin deacetylase (PgdA/CDA1 family)|nr:MAG: polysaccharide deacetylase family protein [Burkholderiales bacterium]
MLFAPDHTALHRGSSDGLHPSRRTWLQYAGSGALSWALGLPTTAHAATPTQALILCYHRFADTVADSMTVRKTTFADHIKVLQDLGAHIIPLADLVAFRQGKLDKLPPRAVVITADDGHRTVVETMAPMIVPTRWPVTLFIYPSAISNASYAMRWEHLTQLQATGQFDVQSHTYWHPNLVKERKQQSPADFERFARMQLQKSKSVLEARLNKPISYLAWPFGLYDDGLMELATQLGYQASLALGNKACTDSDPIQALPRHLMVDEVSGRRLQQLIQAAFPA